MTWRTVRLEPLDVLALADTRPLDDVGHAIGGTLGPLTFAGALRTAVLREAGYSFARDAAQTDRAVEAAQQVGVPDVGGQMTFEMAGPFLTAADFPWRLRLPPPRFLVKPGRASAPIRLTPDLRLADKARDGVLSDIAATDVTHLCAPEPDCAEAPWHLPLAHLCLELAGAAAEDDPRLRKMKLRDTDTIFTVERRHGHQRSNEGAVEEGGLYSRPVQRYSERWITTGLRCAAPACLVRGVGVDPLDGATVRLGGDGRRARLAVGADDEGLAAVAALGEIVRQAIGTGHPRVLMYLATPTVLEKGWQPPRLAGLELRAALVGPPVAVAGWDAKAGRPRPVWRAVPAGSVYYFEVTDNAAAACTVENHHMGRPLSWQHRGLGFGVALFGLW